jgi:beta-xylosidase
MKRLLPVVTLATLAFAARLPAANPIITDVHTADPAAMVHGDTVYLYTGHDEAPPNQNRYVMKNWLCFSSTDMVNWTTQGSPLALTDFKWAKRDAWAGQVIERDGKFFWYVPVGVDTPRGFALGVAVADSPTGPFKDAIGAPLVTSDMTPNPTNPEGVVVSWDDIDPAVFIDDDGQAYLFWGNTNLYWAKLKRSMTELDGPIEKISLPRFTEAPWVHKRGGLYYLSYAYGFPERTAYATAEKATGPWTYRGIIAELAGNCNTNHQAIIEFKGRSYFVYHNGGTLTGGSFRRSVCVDYLDYNPDGTIKRVLPTLEGVGSANEPRPATTAAPAVSSAPKRAAGP